MWIRDALGCDLPRRLGLVKLPEVGLILGAAIVTTGRSMRPGAEPSTSTHQSDRPQKSAARLMQGAGAGARALALNGVAAIRAPVSGHLAERGESRSASGTVSRAGTGDPTSGW